MAKVLAGKALQGKVSEMKGVDKKRLPEPADIQRPLSQAKNGLA